MTGIENYAIGIFCLIPVLIFGVIGLAMHFTKSHVDDADEV